MAASDLPHHEPVGDHSNQAFEQLAAPLRRELKVHCYRMLGSLHEAEGAIQEADASDKYKHVATLDDSCAFWRLRS
jgi:hypothetical protein